MFINVQLGKGADIDPEFTLSRKAETQLIIETMDPFDHQYVIRA